MSDVLSYLSEITHRVSATFLPTEMEDVASFLRGDAWMLVAAQVAPSMTSHNHHSSSTVEGETTTSNNGTTTTSANTARSATLLRYPLGAIRWGHFIPLGIAGTALVSAATSGSLAVLVSFFESNGFAQVFTVNLVATEQQQQQHQQLSGGPLRRTGTNTHNTGVSTNVTFGASSSQSFQCPRSSRSGIGSEASRKRERVLATKKSSTTTTASSAAAHTIDVTLEGHYGGTAQAARHACTAAVRRWFEDLEESLREQEAEGNEAAGTTFLTAATTSGTARATAHKTQLRRLLVLVRCCADNRTTVSTRVAGVGAHGSTHGGAGSVSTSFSAGASSRRHSKGEDPLLLFLHDLAALTTLYEARLAGSACSVRPAVLLLPEDESYGGALLQQRLKEEVGYRYWVQLFLQADPADRQHPKQQQIDGASSTKPRFGVGESWKASLVGRSAARHNGEWHFRSQHHQQGEDPLLRGCRLAAFWGVLDASVLTMSDVSEEQVDQNKDDGGKQGREKHPQATLSGSPSLSSSRLRGHPSAAPAFSFAHATVGQLEEALRRHPACFFTRPSNAPLCVFLMEALRRFPLLAPPAMLRHWQSTWTARHSLNDVLFIIHTTVCPFLVSAVYQGSSSTSTTSHNAVNMDTHELVPSFSQSLRDTTDLLDALLDASFTLAEDRDSTRPLSSNDFCIEQATLFMLMYEALVQQRIGRLRRIPGLVEVLMRLYSRHASSLQCSQATSHGPPAISRGTVAASDANVTTDEKVCYAVQHLLPFAPLNVFYDAVGQRGRDSTNARTSSIQHQRLQACSSKREVIAYPMNSLVLPLRRISVAPQLQNTTLLSLLPPDASLLELKTVAEQLWERELPQHWQHTVRTLTRQEGRRENTSPDLCPSATSGNNISSGSDAVWRVAPTQISAKNFYSPLVPHAVRVLYLLTAHALYAPTEAAKHVPVVQLQSVCQLTDEQLLLVLRELQLAGLADTNLKTQTARTLLDSI